MPNAINLNNLMSHYDIVPALIGLFLISLILVLSSTFISLNTVYSATVSPPAAVTATEQNKQQLGLQAKSQQPPQQLLPIANAGLSQTVNENTKVTLDGRSSHDPDVGRGNIVAYQWTQLHTGILVTFVGANTAAPTLIIPTLPSDTVVAFSLRVMDNHGSISTNTAIVYVKVKQITSNLPAVSSNNFFQPRQPIPAPHFPFTPNQPFPQFHGFR
jgi:hypothetical protein